MSLGWKLTDEEPNGGPVKNSSGPDDNARPNAWTMPVAMMAVAMMAMAIMAMAASVLAPDGVALTPASAAMAVATGAHDTSAGAEGDGDECGEQ